MKALSVFLKDLKFGAKKPLNIISFIAVIFVPILYSGMLIAAFWDPYGHLDKLPVAVVNMDKGAEYEGDSLQIGSDLVDELKENKDFDWKFVSEQEAEQGIADNKYYMKITIPENFSSQATTLMEDNPQPAELIYEPNGDYNFIAGQIGNSAVKDIKSQVSAKVTEAYTESLLGKVTDLSSGLADAGSGAGDIHEGASKLEDGTAKLKENLNKLVKGTDELSSGLSPLRSGVDKLSGGAGDLKSGTANLASGLDQLSAAHKQLENGTVQAVDGVNQLADGLKKTQAADSQINQGIHSALEGSQKLQQGLQSSVDSTDQLVQGASGVAQGLEQLLKANPELAQNADVQKLLATSQAVAQGTQQLQEGQKQLLEGSGQLVAGNEQLASGSDQVVSGQQQLVQGAAKLQAAGPQLTQGMSEFGKKLAEAASGSHQVAAGAGQLAAGTTALQQGVAQLGGGVSALASGSKQLDEGAGTLKSGMADLVSGSGELASKLNDAADQTAQVKSGDDVVSMYAQPVDVDENDSRKISKYGTGIAPYFLSLGLFVGALLSTIILSLRGTSVEGATAWQRFVSRFLTFGAMSLFQSLVAAFIVHSIVGLEVASVPRFYLFTFICSLTFMMVIQAIVTWLDQPGRFVAILLLIFQLTTSGGTFPVELLPDWMQPIHPWLPMSHSVEGFKAVIASGDFSIMWSQLDLMLIYAVIFAVLTLLYFITHTPRESSVSSNKEQTAASV
ncbi:YhgE/Pip domain-containing protein [Paenibacillus physcomitrellae]|uniref:Phage infection protein n=1 Tax=Paenibacillus physcomitrellae TaxID=1619311 RepID=A0ABQ1FR57_9BACL|nr:YhgE/Pip domain-containing protein [Paenibacillus physcomitrellae]GGA27460.1 phage infection protein [Paenibacillus physcomitrellae]